MSAVRDTEHVELPITGMTCASCADRIERKLNRLDGVCATVNFATEKAAVDYDPAIAQPEDLLGAVEAVGYQAVLPRPRGHPTAPPTSITSRPTRELLCAAGSSSPPPCRSRSCCWRWCRRCSSTTGSG